MQVDEMCRCGPRHMHGLSKALQMLQEELRAEIRSFNAVCAILTLLLGIGRGLYDVRVAASKLDAALAAHSRLHKAAYGEYECCNRVITVRD